MYDNEDVAIKTFVAATPDMPYKMLRNVSEVTLVCRCLEIKSSALPPLSNFLLHGIVCIL